MIPRFLVQFGIRPPELPIIPTPLSILDDPPRPDIPFTNGIVSYAGSGKNSRSTQIFITYGTQKGLGAASWETPVGLVSEADMKNVVEKLYSYGDMPPWGKGPNPQRIASESWYLDTNFPMLSKIISCQNVAVAGNNGGSVVVGGSGGRSGSSSSEASITNLPGLRATGLSSYSAAFAPNTNTMLEHFFLFGVLLCVIFFVVCFVGRKWCFTLTVKKKQKSSTW